MSIAEFIRESVLRPRLERAGCMVVYDPQRRYLSLCRALAADDVVFVDASDSSIESREAASQAIVALGRAENGPRELLVYVPAAPPFTDEQRQADPFSVYAACGAMFPEGDGDDYLSLCLKAKPDHGTEIRRLFEHAPSPSFDLIDNVGGGLKWPTLRTALAAESTRDILFGLLAPSEKQREGLQASDAWLSEVKALLAATMGLKLITRGKSWTSISEEMWRFVLFSEFAFDLPTELPSALANVPHALGAARPLIEDLCERLRSDMRSKPVYIDRAERIEEELELARYCGNMGDLGARDTFAFEQQISLARCVKLFADEKFDTIRDAVERQRGSVWIGKGESQAQWGLVEATLGLMESCDDADRQLTGHARRLETLVDYYVASLCEVDRRQREFERAIGDYISPDEPLAEVISHGRRRYSRLMEQVETIFTRHLEVSGWPPAGRLANVDVFDRFVQPLLQESGRRVAYILVDALRYELGVALHAQLADTEQVELISACAQLPSVTPVGMASLLPGAGQALRLLKEGQGFVAAIGETRLVQVGHRMEVLRTRFGDRFAELSLSRFVAGKEKVASTVELLVLRSNEIDNQLESNPEGTLGLIHQMLKSIRVAVDKLRRNNFNDVVIATDHGFFLNAHAEAGDICSKPPGNWIIVHDRSLLGDGAGDSHNFTIPAEKVGIRGDFAQFGGPRSMAPYRRGVLYFHGGASLQEAVVPVLTVRLRKSAAPVAKASVTLSYKNGAKRVTTRLPVVDLAVETSDMLTLGEDVEILLEAHDKKGAVVGEAKPGGTVNAATGTIALKPGHRAQVTVRMEPDFEGKFALKALNPITLAVYATLELETDYAV
jgi:hypothetical protein